ncbi:MAG: DUF2079 domain-containing protein [Candidatus Izemoplasmatales bacterium]|jgi:uncharacterized membrane protein|nr:DUF2079 domain-containing protein [Candidatus Izemoplasmatales bacterium]
MNILTNINPKKIDIKSIILIILSSLAIAFFFTSTVGIFKYDLIRNYYNLKLVKLSELLPFFVTFTISFIVIILLIFSIIKEQLENLTAFFWLFFLFVFAYFAPVKSLAIGALVFALPALYTGILNFLKKYESSLLNIIKWILSSLNVLIFIGLIIILINKFSVAYSPISGVNGSQISDDLIYNQVMQKRFIIAIIIFGGLSVLYTVSLFIKYLKRDKVKKLLTDIGFNLVALILLVQVIVFSLFMVYRLKAFATSTYDFGIFIQMFYNMRDFNGMITSLERSVLISHNMIHFSPIYYLMLPVFMVFPYPETLQILQILIVASGVFPLWLIMKEFKTRDFFKMLVIIMYVMSPAIITSSFYDLHENCFLPPLLLFVLYFGIKKQTIPLIIFTVLTLLVKEDASLYLVFIGLYFFSSSIFNKKKKTDFKQLIQSLSIVIFSMIYFLLITSYLNEAGDGAMFWRYNNINIDNELGIKGIIAGFVLNPSYFLATFFSPMKINTLLLVIGSLGLLPFLVKNKSAYFLAAPLIVMNYLSTYPYQHQFGFQYFYGSTTLLIFMVLLVDKENSELSFFKNKFSMKNVVNVLALLGVAVSLTFGSVYIYERKWTYETYLANQEMYDSMKETMNSIPKDKAIVASGYLTPHLADRELIFDYSYFNLFNSDYDIDYVIIDGRIDSVTLNQMIDRIELAGFIESDLSTEYILIFESLDNIE